MHRARRLPRPLASAALALLAACSPILGIGDLPGPIPDASTTDGGAPLDADVAVDGASDGGDDNPADAADASDASDATDGATPPVCEAIATQNHVVRLAISPAAANVSGAGSTPFKLYAYYSNDPAYGVPQTASAAWSATGLDLSASPAGVVSYGGTAQGVGAVTASLGGLTASANVRVWDAARLQSVASLSTTGISAIRTQGSCDLASVTAKLADGSTDDVTATTLWTSDSNAVNVLPGGLLVYDGGAAGGKPYKITASLVAGGPSTTSTVNIVGAGAVYPSRCADARAPGPLVALAVSAPSTSIYVGQIVPLAVTGYYADGSIRDASQSAFFATCALDATARFDSVLSVAADGWVTGIGVGASKAVASLGSVVASATMSVTTPLTTPTTLTSLVVQPTAANVVVGSAVPLRAVGTYQGFAGLTWNVTHPAGWKLGAKPTIALGNFPNLFTATGVAAGPTVVTVNVPGFGSATANVLAWTAADAANLTSTTLTVSGTGKACGPFQLVLTGHFGNNKPDVDLTPSTQWTPLGRTAYGTLDQTGLYKPIGDATGIVVVYGSLGRGFDSPQVGFANVTQACP